MSKLKNSQQDASTPASALDGIPMIAPDAAPSIMPDMAPAKTGVLSAIETTKTEGAMALCAQVAEPPKIDPAIEERKSIAQAMRAIVSRWRAGGKNFTAEVISNNAVKTAIARLFAMRAMPLTLSIALAAGGGAFAGALFTATRGQAPQKMAVEENRPLQNTIAQLERDIHSLKTGVDSMTKGANAQMARMAERLDRAEQAQIEPSARLARLDDAVRRLDQRSSMQVDTTGSTGALRQTPPTRENQAPKPAVIEGWILRNVYDGVALIQGRHGLIEVEPGDAVPGIGRVETIQRRNGRWVVVTSKGLIAAP